MNAFSEKLKELRNEKGLTQRNLAKVLNIKQQSYARYELGTGEPSLSTLVMIAKFFDVTVDFLLGAEK